MTTIKKTCTCKSAFQDQEYGKQVRVFNLAGKNQLSARCTVCEKIIVLKEDKTVKP